MKPADLSPAHFLWLVESLCLLLQRPFQRDLLQKQYAPPHSPDHAAAALQELGLEAKPKSVKPTQLHRQAFPLLVWWNGRVPALPGAAPAGGAADGAAEAGATPAVVLQASPEQLVMVFPGDTEPRVVPLEAATAHLQRSVWLVSTQDKPVEDPDNAILAAQARRFGFRWFVPELLRHKRLWQEILLASLVIQLLALATPLFTQTVIDKVIVHRTQSTLVVILIGMAIFMVFSALLSWLRQYLVLHTGNRVDAVLGAAVFERLFKLPPLYFQHRPTGVIAARLHGVETIREFIASTAVTLILDLPFLLIFVAIMLYYSVTLSAIALGVMGLIVLMSALVAPVFQRRLQEQFLLGARNQAFVTEYVAGLETVKSLQFEPQLASRYRQYLASYLSSTFATKQIANSYNSASQLLEQLMNMLILGMGAWMVMTTAEFTIGMLIAFQMFASRVSQPMLRMVGIWQQFQQAQISVERLGDLMNAPVEPYSLAPRRLQTGQSGIELQGLSFRYSDKLPWLYQGLNAHFPMGQTIAIMGPSGSGKSTLAKILQGFYHPSEGRIQVDGVDTSNLSANELRSYFGVVPQETTLFSGTILDNLQMASPLANFEAVVTACKLAEIHTVIEGLPDGYQTEIGERGAGLSGGQRQRIAIARALLKRPRILVFDEATSALDQPTAEQFAKTINSLRGKVTMLFITHAVPRNLKLDRLYHLTPRGLQEMTLAPAAVGVTP
jgi:subfamily B ATP-binding cassette protein HlyB/CyaB